MQPYNIRYQEKLSKEQRIARLRSQKENAQRAAAILLTLHTIKDIKLNVSHTAQRLASSIRRDTEGGDASDNGVTAIAASFV